MITDTIRAVIMEYFGYKTQVMEFIETEHTPKNVLLAGSYSGPVAEEKRSDIARKISEMKRYYGIETHYLEKVMGLKF